MFLTSLDSNGFIDDHILSGILLQFLGPLILSFDEEAPVRFVDEIQGWHKKNQINGGLINPYFPHHNFLVIFPIAEDPLLGFLMFFWLVGIEHLFGGSEAALVIILDLPDNIRFKRSCESADIVVILFEQMLENLCVLQFFIGHFDKLLIMDTFPQCWHLYRRVGVVLFLNLQLHRHGGHVGENELGENCYLHYVLCHMDLYSHLDLMQPIVEAKQICDY